MFFPNRDTRMCMQYIAYWGGRNKIVFMGDSRIRQIYNSFTRHVASHDNVGAQFAHHDLYYSEKDKNLDVEFLWQPVLNSSMFEVYHKWLNMEASSRPKIVVTGAATWSIKTSNAS